MASPPRYRPMLEALERRDALAPAGGSIFTPAPPDVNAVVLKAAEVEKLLDRAVMASASDDGIMAIVDRGGNILGVRMENGVAAAIQADPELLTFAVDGAVAKARTGAFFANNNAPLTSRTVQFISQTTMTQREIQSYPFIPDPNSTERGPGFVAPVGVKNHFPPDVAFTPQVDLFAIEHTNRDSIIHPGPDGIKGNGDDIPLPYRFNINPAFVPAGKEITPPESYGFVSGLDPDAQSRGIATLPGGLPIYKDGALVGGIGVFYPGQTGWATAENSALNNASGLFNPNLVDRSFEAEYVAFAAVGGAPLIGAEINLICGMPRIPNVFFPLTKKLNRIDLVGITLDIVGPGGVRGVRNLLLFGGTLGSGCGNAATELPIGPGPVFYKDGVPVPEGWLVMPHDGVNVTAAQVRRIVRQGIAEANRVRAAIRLPLGFRTRMVFAVTDETGEVLGLFRMTDATVFSIDVAVAKARNVAYYASDDLQPIDQIAGVPKRVAFTNRTFRYAALPRFPEGIDGQPAGPMSIFNDGCVNPLFARNTCLLPASAYQSAQGFDAFNPGRNFHDPDDIANQNGVVFFPGSAPIYHRRQLIGGFGVSGDGVDQDDVVTFAGAKGFGVPAGVLRADQVRVRGVRLPYQKFNRNPIG